MYAANSPPHNPMQGHAGNLNGQQDVGALGQQFGQMNVDGTTGTNTQPRRKKDRHAYHQLEQPAGGSTFGSPGLNAAPGQQQYDAQPVQNSPGLGAYNASPAAPWLQSQQQSPQTPQWQTFQSAQPSAATPGTGVPFSAPGGQPGQMAPSQNRVNPDQIPGVPLSRDLPAEYYKTHMYPTMEQHLPPPAITPMVAIDQGNASPRFARLTVNSIPTSHEQLATTSLPLGLVVQPLAKQPEGENAIPVLDFGDVGPPRCRRCRAYINPFMIFSHGGSRMTCNLCGHASEVGSEYFAPTDPSGVRVDRMQRPELLLGTCEFLVPKEYWSQPPTPMHYMCLIDVSAESINRGFLQAVCDGILHALYGDEAASQNGSSETDEASRVDTLPEGAKFGFMTYDRDIHFYNVGPGVSTPQQLVVTDLEDPFAAISTEHLFVDPRECRENISSLLKKLPAMFSRVNHAELALLPSLNAALSALESLGGKIFCSISSLPNYGPGRLQQRDKGQVPNDDGDSTKELLRTENVVFRKCQADMVKAGVGVDFLMAAPMGGYLDIATIGYVAEKTGGETYYYPNWTYPRDALRVQKEIKHAIRREQGYAALMKVRCSNGLQIASYSGNFTQHTFGADLELASVTEDSALSVTFSYDGKLDPKLDAHFQSALLYTTASGQRRVRCSNVVASVTEQARESMRFVDQDAVLCVMAKEFSSRVGERNLKDVRQALQDKTTDVLASYRKNFSGSHPPGQLVLPENLKEFGIYTLGLMKSRALKAGREPSDRRIQEVRMLKGMGPAELSLYLYPRIIALHGLDPAEGFADDSGQLRMPRAIRASFSQIEQGGAYLVDNGQLLLLWLHQQVSPNLLEDLFGPDVRSLQDLDANLSSLPVLDTLLNAQVRNILLNFETQRGSKGMAIQLARQGLDGAEFEFARLLYEDRNGDASSYVDWLVMLHRGVGMEVSRT